MKTLVLAMAMASTLLTPTTASAAVSPSAEARTERLADTRVDLAGERDQSRREVRQQRRGARQAERRVDRSQTRGADRRVEQRQARRAERRRIGRVEQRQVTRQQRRAERRVDRRIADRRIERRVDRQVDRRIANRQADRRYDRRVDRRIDNRQYDRRGVVRADRQWNRQWRNNRRYNFDQYRRSNRQIFNPGRYYSPYRNRGYSRYNIGLNIGRGFYGNRYWINDPYRYRLPPVYGGYRWIRYFNDALLIDTRSGVVADAVYGLFY